jgi:hypothetical protein
LIKVLYLISIINLVLRFGKNVFEENDVNVMFNSFLNIYLRHIYTIFPKTYIKSFTPMKKSWISPSIKIKCNIKRYLYLICRNSDDPNIKSFYKAYCKSLARDILKTKRSYYDKLISDSNYRIKSSWNIVKVLTGRKSSCNMLPTSKNFDRVRIN